MVKYAFGKDFTLPFYYSVGQEPSADAPTVYIFNERPSRDDVENGTATYLVETISSWSDISTGGAKLIGVSAIDDPDPDSTTYHDTYYAGINYKLQASEQTQRIILPFIVHRAYAQTEQLNIRVADLKANFPEIATYLTDDTLILQIDKAISEIRSDYEDKGVIWESIKDTDRLTLALGYKVMSNAMLSKFKEPGDGLHERFLYYEDKYKEQISVKQLPVDKDGDGIAESPVKAESSWSINIK